MSFERQFQSSNFQLFIVVLHGDLKSNLLFCSALSTVPKSERNTIKQLSRACTSCKQRRMHGGQAIPNQLLKLRCKKGILSCRGFLLLIRINSHQVFYPSPKQEDYRQCKLVGRHPIIRYHLDKYTVRKTSQRVLNQHAPSELNTTRMFTLKQYQIDMIILVNLQK